MGNKPTNGTPDDRAHRLERRVKIFRDMQIASTALERAAYALARELNGPVVVNLFHLANEITKAEKEIGKALNKSNA